MSEEKTRCGFVSVIGRPNAGKSTLVNALVGAKVSIVSRKVQTTRSRMLGIALYEQSQIILIDTPGVFSPKKTLEKAMVSTALDAVDEGDVIYHLVDVAEKNPLEQSAAIRSKLPKNKPVFLVLNKVDRIKKDQLLALAADFNEVFSYEQTFMISALKEVGLRELAKASSEHMPQGPWHYEEDEITTTPMRLLAAEITREKIFDQLHEELPYAIMVETENWENFDNGDIKISQVITVDRDSQKGIVLGKGGQQIKKIGQAARTELEAMLEQKIHLKLFVRVTPGWQEKAESYQIMGLNPVQ